jgi:hypothetical protein
MIPTLLCNIFNRLYATVQCSSELVAGCMLAGQAVGRRLTDPDPIA